MFQIPPFAGSLKNSGEILERVPTLFPGMILGGTPHRISVKLLVEYQKKLSSRTPDGTAGEISNIISRGVSENTLGRIPVCNSEEILGETPEGFQNRLLE